MELVNSGKAELVVVSLGSRGAFLASNYISITPSVMMKSTIGVGDSMVAGLVYGIINDLDQSEILKWGVACGVATTLTEGSQLGSKVDIEKIIKMLH